MHRIRLSAETRHTDLMKMNHFRLFATALALAISAITAASQTAFFPITFSTLRHPAPGYYLLAPNSFDSVGFVDHGGKTIHAIPARLAASFFWQRDNTVTYIDQGRQFYKVDPRFTVLDTLRFTDFDTDFHECKVLANGNTILFGFEPRTMDLSSVVSGGKTNARVMGARIREVTPGGDTVLDWSSFDHSDVTHAVEEIDLTQQAIDYAHPNGIAEDLDGNLIISVRHFDALLKIDRNTGEVIWWLGGEKAKRNDFTWTNDDNGGFTGFSHQHSVEVMSNGNILLFDNGNMRTTKFSRAVIYDVDEVNKTVTKVWEFRHTPDIYAASMGSVQELPNGNILIGWGSNPTTIIATEVSPDGTVEAELVSNLQEQIRSYRVMKAPFSMTGVQKEITTVGAHTIQNADSTTHLTINVTGLTSATNIVVERHWNIPIVPQFNDADPCRVLPARWSVRANKKNTITASMEFNVGSVPGIDAASSTKLFHRTTEGNGVWSRVEASYESATKNLVVGTFKTGEYLAVYESCLIPYQIAPVNNAVNLPSNDTRFTWSVAVQSGGYQLQVSTAPDFKTTVVDATIEDAEEYTYRFFNSYTKYYWRVRSRLDNNQFGAWSTVWSFKTKLDKPGAISPRVDIDTVSVITKPTLLWTRVGNATSYHVRLFRASQVDSLVLEDTVAVAGMVLPSLLPNTWYAWDVQALANADTSTFSPRVRFLTSPDVPVLVTPDDSTRNVPYRDLKLSWTSVEGALRYRIRITLGGSDSVVTDVETDELTFVTDELVPNQRYRWSVAAVGRYGLSQWANERTYWTAEVGTLAAAVPILPANGAVVERDSVLLVWTQPDATSFLVQVGSSSTMDTLIHTVSGYASTSHIVPGGLLTEGKTYFWRIKASLGAVESTFSTVRRFTVATAPPPPVVGLNPLDPLNGAVDVPRSGTFRWTADSRVDAYTVMLFRGISTTPLRTYNTTDTTAPYSGLDPETMYRWKVVGKFKGAAVDTGSVATFTTQKSDVIASVNENVVDSDGSLHGTVPCDATSVNVAVYELTGRLVERATVAVQHGTWRFTPTSTGVHVVMVTVCGKQTSTMHIAH